MGMYGVQIGPMVTSALVPWSPGVLVGYLSFQRLKLAGGKNLKKKLSNLNISHFLINFFRLTGPMFTNASGT